MKTTPFSVGVVRQTESIMGHAKEVEDDFTHLKLSVVLNFLSNCALIRKYNKR